MSNVPFPTDDDGNYRVIQPAWDMEPDALVVTVEGRDWRLSDYQGTERLSRVIPHTLLYGECAPLDGSVGGVSDD